MKTLRAGVDELTAERASGGAVRVSPKGSRELAAVCTQCGAPVSGERLTTIDTPSGPKARPICTACDLSKVGGSSPERLTALFEGGSE